LMPIRSALASLTRSSAAAPSLIPEEFPAVAVPHSRKAGLSLASDSSVESRRGLSSEITTVSPFRWEMGTGTISPAKRARIPGGNNDSLGHGILLGVSRAAFLHLPPGQPVLPGGEVARILGFAAPLWQGIYAKPLYTWPQVRVSPAGGKPASRSFHCRHDDLTRPIPRDRVAQSILKGSQP
jgi:hypothetical protein